MHMLTKDDLQAIRGVVKEELKPIDRKINKLDKKIDIIGRVLDTDIVNLDKRVTKLESVCLGGSSVN